MLALFCLRLACGLAGVLLLLNPATINPRFLRTHFLTALGLTALAAASAWDAAGTWLVVALGAVMLFGFLGSITWSLEEAPGGRLLMALTTLALATALVLLELSSPQSAAPGWHLAGDLTSAALLGTSFSAMMLGHSYLIAPSMSVAPLFRVLAALIGALGLRLAVAGAGLWFWTEGGSLTNLTEAVLLWLPVRWGLGFVAPLVLTGMAWQTARIRSTQSATGILYVVVICCFLGELTSQLLLSETHYPL
jgi:hypothetical protein